MKNKLISSHSYLIKLSEVFIFIVEYAWAETQFWCLKSFFWYFLLLAKLLLHRRHLQRHSFACSLAHSKHQQGKWIFQQSNWKHFYWQQPESLFCVWTQLISIKNWCASVQGYFLYMCEKGKLFSIKKSITSEAKKNRRRRYNQMTELIEIDIMQWIKYVSIT
jgi:hypothetical protein